MSVKLAERVPSRRARTVLALGATVGLACATAGILEPSPESGRALPEGAAAVVDGSVIRKADFDRALSALAADSRNAIGEAERRHVMDRLIEEELLVQRARELGFDQHDGRVRSLLVSSMIESIVAEVGELEPTDGEMEAFYQENADFFARTGRVWIRQVQVGVNHGRTDEQALELAQAAVLRLRNAEDIEVVASKLGDTPVAPLPDGFLPASQLREYLGPTPARRALELAPGQVSDPVRGGSSYHVLQMVAREPAHVLPLASVASQVRAEMQRRAGDAALRAYLDDLRSRADIRLAKP